MKAATEILDRAGVRGGVEIDTNVNIDVRPAASVIAERLDRLAQGAITTAARLAEAGLHVEPEKEIIDAEIVSDGSQDQTDEPQPVTSNEDTQEK